MERKKELEQWNLLLVNEWNAIPDGFEVVTAEVEDGYVIDERVCDALRKMLADCREAGYSPKIISTFRTREKQQYLYDHTANKADTAVPGHSEHECGLAADIIDAGSEGWRHPLTEEQADMPAQKWLMEHCRDYGFILRYPKDKTEITNSIRTVALPVCGQKSCQSNNGKGAVPGRIYRTETQDSVVSVLRERASSASSQSSL